MGKFADSRRIDEPKPMLAPTHGVRVGDIFVEHWGYDQTNIDAFIVVRVTPAMVAIMKCPLKTVGEGHSTKVMPNPASPPVPFRPEDWNSYGKPNAAGEVMKKPQRWNDDQVPYLSMTSYSIATLWDGERAYFDTIAAGYPGH